MSGYSDSSSAALAVSVFGFIFGFTGLGFWAMGAASKVVINTELTWSRISTRQ